MILEGNSLRKGTLTLMRSKTLLMASTQSEYCLLCCYLHVLGGDMAEQGC